MSSRLPPVQAWSSAFIAAIVGFGGTIALIIQALRALGASVEQTQSAITALCLGIALGSVALSLRTRMPIVLAWSTPGAALLAATTTAVSWPIAVGVFISAGLMMIVFGLVPVLGRLAARIPESISSAMLAGVLLPFCLDAFRLGSVDPLLIVVLVGVFILGRQIVPLYTLLLVLVAGVAVTVMRGDMAALPAGATFGTLQPVMPSFGISAILSLGLPLFLVTLMSQNLPGLVVLRSAGYHPQPGPLFVGTGVMTMLTAPFGALAVNLAAITAALCTSSDAHPDRANRWVVAVLYAGMYLLLAIFSPALVRLFLGLPHTLIAALTGLALVPALMNSAANMLQAGDTREVAILTFLTTGSGLALYGLGSAFWGLLVGCLVLGIKLLWWRRATG